MAMLRIAREISTVLAFSYCASVATAKSVKTPYVTANRKITVDIRPNADANTKLDVEAIKPLINELSEIPKHCSNQYGQIVLCNKAASILKTLDDANWCNKDALYWFPCVNRNADRLKYASSLLSKKDVEKFYVFGEFPLVIGKEVEKSRIVQSFYPDRKCELPIVNAEHMRLYKYSGFDQKANAMGIISGCYAKLLNGRYAAVDAQGNSHVTDMISMYLVGRVGEKFILLQAPNSDKI